MENFFEYVKERLYFGTLPDSQKLPLTYLIQEGMKRKRRVEDIAYVLATAHHETGRFRWDEEIGQGAEHDYGEPIWLIRGKSVAYYGRGPIMLTWLHNYATMSILTGRNLVSNPDLVKEWPLAGEIIWEGMIGGLFRPGHSLTTYINNGGKDYFSARNIVNGGLDRAGEIEKFAIYFEEGLRLVEDFSSTCPCCGQEISPSPLD